MAGSNGNGKVKSSQSAGKERESFGSAEPLQNETKFPPVNAPKRKRISSGGNSGFIVPLPGSLADYNPQG